MSKSLEPNLCLRQEIFNQRVVIIYRDNMFYRSNINNFIETWQVMGTQVEVISVPENLQGDEEIKSYIEKKLPKKRGAIILTDNTCYDALNFYENDDQYIDGGLDEIAKSDSEPERMFEKMANKECGPRTLKDYEVVYNKIIGLHKKTYPPQRVIIGMRNMFDHDRRFQNLLLEQYLKENPEEELGKEDAPYSATQGERQRKFLEYCADFVKKILIKNGILEEIISIKNEVIEGIDDETDKIINEKNELWDKAVSLGFAGHLSGEEREKIKTLQKKLEEIKMIFYIKSDTFSEKDWLVCDGHQVRPTINMFDGEEKRVKPHIVLLDFDEEVNSAIKIYTLDVPFIKKNEDDRMNDVLKIINDFNNFHKHKK